MTIVDATDAVELKTIAEAKLSGGCLGYGASGPRGNLPVYAFHVPFSTWQNERNLLRTDDLWVKQACEGPGHAP